MIIDTLQNAAKYYGVHPLFKQAFEYIAAQNLDAIEIGKFDFADGLKDKQIINVLKTILLITLYLNHINININMIKNVDTLCI